MRIQSNFVDYYDYLAHQFGADPKIFYLRQGSDKTYFTPISNECPIVPNTPSYDHYSDKFIGLAVCGKYYLLKWNYIKQYSPFDPRFVKFQLITGYKSWNYVYGPGKHYAGLDEVSKEIGQPIFLFSTKSVKSHGSWKTQFELYDFLIPLQPLSFHKVYPAEQIYQDLQYYIANVLNDGIDLRPPTEIADIDKVVQYGFDKKQSYRHRKT